jgi:uncharacterized membrane protein (DUF2068 family)
MRQPSPHTGLAAVALFELAKGVVSLLVGVALLRLVDPEVATFLAPVMDLLHLHSQSRLLHSLLLKVTALSPHNVFLMASASLLYAVLLFVEGFGLWLRASWAAYMTVISTSLFLPVEFDEVVQYPTSMHVAVLLINMAIVVYLVTHLGRRSMQERGAAQADP